MLTQVNRITEKFINEVSKSMQANKMVRCRLPHNGRLYIERQLPFLCLYRMPPEYEDCGTEKLITGEASYLIASGMKELHKNLSLLTVNMIKMLSHAFGAFLIVEVWATKEQNEEVNDSSFQKPFFRILSLKSGTPEKIMQTLEEELKKITIHKKTAEVALDKVFKITPHGFPQILPSAEAKKLNCSIVGLELKPVYRNWQTGEPYPLVIRSLHRMIARVLKRTFFEFVQAYTTHRPANYHALGKRACVKAVWEVDRKLAEISDTFDFLLQATPVNTNKAWYEFKRKHFEHIPVFHYRPVPVEPAKLKQALYNIHIDRVEDPTLAQIFREKRRDLDRQITMLADRNSRRFFYGSMQLYGGVDERLLHLAEKILKKAKLKRRDNRPRGYIRAEELIKYAEEEISYYRTLYPELSSQVIIRDDISGLIVSRGNFLIGKDTRIQASRVEAILHHEVGTHVVTFFNAKAQPFQLLHSGLAEYEELQEGMAVLSEYLSGGLNIGRLRLIASRVSAVKSMIEGASFIDTFRMLNQKYGFEQHTAFTITMRVYRGGGLTKDAIYFRGFIKLLEYLQKGGALDPLFIGKISLKHVPIILELRSRHILNKIPIIPRYMTLSHVAQKIEDMRNGLSIQDLMDD